MASTTNKEKVAKRRSAGEMFRSIEDQATANKVPQLAELLMKVGEKVGIDQIAEVFATTFREGTDAAKRNMALEYSNLLKQYQQMTGEMNRDEIARMSDNQIEAILRDKFGFTDEVTESDGSSNPPQPEGPGPAEIVDSGDFQIADGNI